MSRIRVIGIGGSFSTFSSSLAALKATLEAARAAGADVEVFDVSKLALPMYDGSREAPPAVAPLIAACASAQGFVWSSPLYQGTISGALKNALDWLELLSTQDPPYLTNKVVGFVSTAAGGHALQAIHTMEKIARALRAWGVPLVGPIQRAQEVFDRDGSIKDAKTAELLTSIGREVVKAATLLSRPA